MTKDDRNLPIKKDTMGNNEGNVDATLKQRGSIYGSYKKVISTRVAIMSVLKNHHYNTKGVEMHQETETIFNDLVLKLVRAAGAPEYADSFHDLAGYAKLMEDIANEK